MPLLCGSPRSAPSAHPALSILPAADRRQACRRAPRCPDGGGRRGLRERAPSARERASLGERTRQLARAGRRRGIPDCPRWPTRGAPAIGGDRLRGTAAVPDAGRARRSRCAKGRPVERGRAHPAPGGRCPVPGIGGAVPPPADVLALAREASAATLRSFMPHATEVEVAGARCCPACRIDDGLLMTIVEALREPRLPHEGCPKGICPCDWWPLVGKTPRRRKRLTPGAR